MSRSIAVIGAGWYGCHIATSLLALGFQVTIFERHRRVLEEASGNNQFRLHLGFHYPRHHVTRQQSRDGFLRFIERYPTLSKEIPENVYAVPQNDSLIDFPTYRLIMTASGIEFTEIDSCTIQLRNIQGAILVKERVVLLSRARKYFQERLESVLQLDSPVTELDDRGEYVLVNGQQFDIAIDATWGHLTAPPMPVIYEPTLLLYYESKSAFPAVTLVDGPLCSVYPTEDPGIFTLSSVVHTSLGQFSDVTMAKSMRDSVTTELVSRKATLMEEQIARYIPDFCGRFRLLGPQLSIKTKMVASHDDRSCYVARNGNVFTVLSGKIDTVFFAMERIITLIEMSYASDVDDTQSSLKRTIDVFREKLNVA